MSQKYFFFFAIPQKTCFLTFLSVQIVIFNAWTQKWFMETVICYLLFVSQKIRFGKLSTVTLVNDDIDYG